MIPILEDAILGNDLDCQNFTLRNVRNFYPVPPGLVAIDDPRLDDPRTPPAASITNEHISATAGIEQWKLDLSRGIPGEWLGDQNDQAAQGDLVERVANKGVPNGYAEVDSNLKLLASSVSTGASPGTVSSVNLDLPPEFEHSGAAIETSGSFTVDWVDAPDNSYLGTYGLIDLSGVLRPSFITGPLPIEVIPAIDAAKFTSGVFPVSLFPADVLLPTPGEFGDPNQYVGRDMEWHHFNSGIAYQPTIQAPAISLSYWSEDGTGTVTIDTPVDGSVLFYRFASSGSTSFVRAPGTSVLLTLPDGDFVEAYSAKAGYNNSDISTYIVVTPLSEVT